MSEPGVEVPDEAPEADVLEQYQSSSGLEERDEPTGDVPVEANPADVDEQRRSLGEGGEDDYR
ncbi:hypothetical protein Kfla_5358 [Kribbella flavida DSM 17836]|uniref:Uncharacterized protein n=1 Tax=Kribbella flavida (strain DSM 17836 / JCM 10339 / NBRC 14399) TaxID=479435 RepID=D2PLB6_KRIFD|nr:hypothetical protein [Kribbella flavida]ADB34371.1 hypothetical protein Kfla_5358 [Kribbella flavida DSM 17836]